MISCKFSYAISPKIPDISKAFGFLTADELINSLIENLPWIFLDRMMRETRAKLENDFAWRMGGSRVRKIYLRNASIAQEELGRLPRRFMDFGAGMYHPLANALLFWLDGAELCVGVEKDSKFSSSRAAGALLDLVYSVITEPRNYLHQDVDLAGKLKALDLPALKRGDFHEGLGSAPLNRFCGDVQDFDQGDFDFIVSHAVSDKWIRNVRLSLFLFFPQFCILTTGVERWERPWPI